MDWPYDDDPSFAPLAASPTWHCPEDLCQCGKVHTEPGEHEIAIVLLSPTGERMKNARCRVLYQGRVMNEEQPSADADGVVHVSLPYAPVTLIVEWAPPDAPKTPGYPYRCLYYAELGEGDTEAGRRRLHNLGYVRHVGLRENVKAFQREYGYQDVSGKLADIKEDLRVFHDEGRPPITKPEPTTGGGSPPPQGRLIPIPTFKNGRIDKSSSSSLVPSSFLAKTGDTEGAKDDSPNDEPTAKKLAPQKGGGAAANQGSAKATPTLPTINQVIASKTALFEMVLLYVEWTDPKDANKTAFGFFWIFADALMWEVPNDADWGFWKGTAVSQPLPQKPFGGVKIGDRKRLIRLPCTGRQAQLAADSLSLTQADLLSMAGSDMVAPDANDAKVPCILPTAELYDESYLQAEVRINPQNQTITSLTPNVLSYNEAVAKAFDAATKANTSLTGTPKSLGTPGKIWAIAERMDTWVCCCSFSNWAFACITHGFHDSIVRSAGKKPRAHAIQTKGGCHDWDHTDYSQIFSAVAGWCWVQDVGESQMSWKRTASAYRSQTLCNLVRDTSVGGRATIAPAVKYVGNVANTAAPKTDCKAGLPPCPPLKKPSP